MESYSRELFMPLYVPVKIRDTLAFLQESTSEVSILHVNLVSS